MHFRFAAGLLVAVTLAAAACGGVTDPSKNRTETFTGTLTIGGNDIKQFSASNSGEYAVTVTSLSPSQSVFLYVAFGQIISGQCSITQATSATVGFQALGGAIVPGSYCVEIADANAQLKQTSTYVMTVSHP